MPEIARPGLLFLTQADDSLVAVDPKMIYLMRPAPSDPRDPTFGSLTRIFLSIGPGQTLTVDVRETVQQIGDTLHAAAEGATLSLAPTEAVSVDG